MVNGRCVGAMYQCNVWVARCRAGCAYVRRERFVGTLCRCNGAIGKYDGCVAGCENKLQVRWSMC